MLGRAGGFVSSRAVTLVGLSFLLLACQSPSPAPPELRTPDERFSYAVGAKLGADLRRSGHALDRERLLRGVEDGLENRVALSDAELAGALEAGVESQRERLAARQSDQAAAAEREGRAFLAANAARAGVVTLPSGVQYEVLRAGSGKSPGVEDFVTCSYRGSLLDGTVFDDTQSLGRPRTFAVTSVVDGLEEALTRMSPGARWKVWVPPEKGYGASRPGAKVPPNATLVFEIELIELAKRPSY
jgi:FKBP-type peptidyl-prolyl cis-trans isomerase FklB